MCVTLVKRISEVCVRGGNSKDCFGGLAGLGYMANCQRGVNHHCSIIGSRVELYVPCSQTSPIPFHTADHLQYCSRVTELDGTGQYNFS